MMEPSVDRTRGVNYAPTRYNNFELSRSAFFHRWEITRNWWSRRVLSPTTRDSRISSAMPTVAEYGDCFVHGLSLMEAWTRGGWLKRATIGGGVEYEKRMGSAGVGCE